MHPDPPLRRARRRQLVLDEYQDQQRSHRAGQQPGRVDGQLLAERGGRKRLVQSAPASAAPKMHDERRDCPVDVVRATGRRAA